MQEIKRILHPKAVTVVTVNGQKVGRETFMEYMYTVFVMRLSWYLLF